MSIRLRIVYSSLTGAIGALAAWFTLDILFNVQITNPYLDAIITGTVLGVFIGVGVNGYLGLMEFKILPLVKGIAVGFLAGLFGGGAGLLLAEFLYEMLGGETLPRILGWMVFGMLLGIADGILALSLRRILYAAAGGFLGGLVGGTTFSLLAGATDLPYTSRALGFTFIGLLTGLFIGLVPNLLKYAWLKVVSSGRNVGKERIADKRRIVLGSSSGCDLPLYGDLSIAPRHAEIIQDKGQYILRPIGAAPILVRGLPVYQHILEHEDEFQIGTETILFRRRKP